MNHEEVRPTTKRNRKRLPDDANIDGNKTFDCESQLPYQHKTKAIPGTLIKLEPSVYKKARVSTNPNSHKYLLTYTT